MTQLKLLTDLEWKVKYDTNDLPLVNFYVPALERGIRYDRTTGFFSAAGLAKSSDGLVRFIQNGGKMRLLVSTKLEEEDIKAIMKGEQSIEGVTGDRLLKMLEHTMDGRYENRLRILSGMLQHDHLEIRVCVDDRWQTEGQANLPGLGLFHSKTGIIEDAAGNLIAWSGSDNETEAGKTINFEKFHVSCSWLDGRDQERVTEEVYDFEQLWTGHEPGWSTLSVSEAAKEKLLSWFPPCEPWPPNEDEIDSPLTPVDSTELVKAAWLRDVPHLVGTLPDNLSFPVKITPWPHQSRVARSIVRNFPDRYLLADEVGLGKTIEAGLALRELILTGLVRRALILAPKSVLSQWQDELWEKFSLSIPRYDQQKMIWPNGFELELNGREPWDPSVLHHPDAPTHPGEALVLLSSQLIKRIPWRERLYKTRDWDLVVVDEAHHARRKGFDNPDRYQPNRLLELLEGTDPERGLAFRTKGLLLLTATPMQVSPIEVWDLLKLFGLPGQWGTDPLIFQHHHTNLHAIRTNPSAANWELASELACSELAREPIGLSLSKKWKEKLGSVDYRKLVSALDNHRMLRQLAEERDDNGELKYLPALLEILDHLTPLRRKMHRFSRETLKRYALEGIEIGRLAEREPEPIWTEMSAEESELYDKVEEYITDFYKKYEGERKGLGFVMTVYRRRLTSSFHALSESLKRRLNYLEGNLAKPSELLTDDDLEEEILDLDRDDDLDEQPAGGEGLSLIRQEEIRYVERFIQEIADLPHDSKLENLREQLEQLLQSRDSVVIFTQYTDTMDHLRDTLKTIYGNRVACYSGRGGERWDGTEWQLVPKAEIKGDFTAGKITILLGTDALAEGLNLQTCGIEINYDVPWNPMRLEQRIGRIDRIGQDWKTLWIRSYFLEGTIEAEVYRRLKSRIDWFLVVVGALQPILHQISKLQKDASMIRRGEERDEILDQGIERIGMETVERQDGFGIHDTGEELFGVTPADLVSSEEIERFLTEVKLPGFRLEKTSDGLYQLMLDGKEHLVAFDDDAAGRSTEKVRLLDWGDQLFLDILSKFPDPEPGSFNLIRASTERSGRNRVGWFRVMEDEEIAEIQTWKELGSYLDSEDGSGRATPDRVVSGASRATVRDTFVNLVEKEEADLRERMTGFWEEQRSSLEQQSAKVIERAYYLALLKNTTLEDRELRTPSSHDARTILEREGFPFSRLLSLITGPFEVSEEDDRWNELKPKSERSLQSSWTWVKKEATRLLSRLEYCHQQLSELDQGNDQIEIDLEEL